MLLGFSLHEEKQVHICRYGFCAMMETYTTGERKLILMLSGHRYLMSDLDCLDQIGHNHFEVAEDCSSTILKLTLKSEAISLLVNPSSQTCGHYQLAEKKRNMLRCSEEKRCESLCYLCLWNMGTCRKDYAAGADLTFYCTARTASF